MSRASHARDYNRLRRELRTARLAATLTQAQLATLLGLPQSFVSKYENGERRLDLIETVRILRALDLDPIRFLTDFLS